MDGQEFVTSSKNERIKISDFSKSALIQILYFSLAFLLASSSTNELFSPLGIAFCSGTGRKNTLFSCLGAMLGYLLSNEYISAFRYIMALILVYILKVYANSFDSIKGKISVMPVIALFATVSTGIIVTVTSAFNLNHIFLRTAEAMTSFGGAYFFAGAFKSAEKLLSHKRISNRELTSLMISLLIIILSAKRISVIGISLSGIVCSYVIMVSAYLFNENGGAIIGTGASLGLAMSGNSSPTVFCYSAAGLFSGMFSYSGRVLSAMAYIFSYGSMLLLLGGGESKMPLFETAFASVLFIATPQKLFFTTKSLLSGDLLSGEGKAVKNMMISRLKMARDAVGDMSGTVTKVSEILKEKAPPDTAGVYLRVRDSVCSECASFDKCWKGGFPGTVSEFDMILEEIRKSGSITPSFTPPSLHSRCLRIMSLCDSFNKNYSSYSARLGAERRINEMRKITVDQFDSVYDMIDDLLSDFGESIHPLNNRYADLKDSLEDLGISACVNCYEGKNANMLVNLSVKSDCKVYDEDISECIEKVTEKEFAEPVTVENGNEKVFLYWEKPPLEIECNFYQISGEEGEICGDCFDSFYDGKGNFIAVLSDGMGTGNRAAIDGTMASSLFSKLIVSGFSFPCALRLVNSAMLVKSHDESLATLDILKINLYTGESVIYKAGASVSFLRRMGKISEIKKSAMPIGILRKAEFATVHGGLHDNDLVVMMSDGAADNGVDEMKRYINENGYSPDLSQKLCALSRSRCVGRHDDITVATIKIVR